MGLLQEGEELGPSKERTLNLARRKQLSNFKEGEWKRQHRCWLIREAVAKDYPAETEKPNSQYYSHFATVGGMPSEGLQLLPQSCCCKTRSKGGWVKSKTVGH